MAVEFESGYYDGATTEKLRAETWMGPTYGVRGADDWKVTAVPAADRTVSIAPGSGFGHGVPDTTRTNDTIQLDTVASGSRWDMVAVRRDWQPAAGGPSQFVKINGSSAKALPAVGTSTASWNRRPGVVDDQPLYLVQTTAGQTQPTGFVDLRCWAGPGGLVAVDTLALSYLTVPGAAVRIGEYLYTYVPDSNGVFGWDARQVMFREWNAQTSIVLNNAPGATRAISFPAGLFDVPPLVHATRVGGAAAKLIPYVTNVTTGGCTVGLYTGDSSAYAATVSVNVQAVQTSPGRAGGVNP